MLDTFCRRRYIAAMLRFLLAWKCFFLVLFAGRLPAEAASLLPPSDLQPAKLPPRDVPDVEVRELPRPTPVDAERTKAAQPDTLDFQARGAVQLLGLLQREGRLLDFLDENIDSYGDSQVGAAVRDIHRGCKKALAEHLQLEPVLKDADNASVKIDAGFDASRIRLVGNVAGKPPFFGTLRHPGWRGVSVKLPALPASHDPTVIAPAEVEL